MAITFKYHDFFQFFLRPLKYVVQFKVFSVALDFKIFSAC